MPHATTPDGVKLYYEQAGAGPAILFVHEYCGDWRAWEPQMRFFARKYRCVTYSFRGYPGSDVPENAAMYGQKFAVDDAKHILDHLKIAKAHVVGPSPQRTSGASTPSALCRSLSPASVPAPAARVMNSSKRMRGRLPIGSAKRAWQSTPMASRLIRRARASSRRTHAASPSS